MLQLTGITIYFIALLCFIVRKITINGLEIACVTQRVIIRYIYPTPAHQCTITSLAATNVLPELA